MCVRCTDSKYWKHNRKKYKKNTHNTIKSARISYQLVRTAIGTSSPKLMHSTHKCLIACVVSVTSGTAFVTPSLRVAVERSRTDRSFLFRKDGESLECSTRRDIFVQAITASAFLIPTAAQAMYIDPVTRIVLPSEGEIQSAIPNTFYDNPFEDLDKSSFGRLDQTPDTIFYKDPRFTEHVDENAVQTMTRFISNDILKQNDSVLDLCSSWTSHIDKSAAEKLGLQRISGLGMNEEELKANTALNDYTLVDLNANPNVVLPYGDSSFDVVLCQLSIDYLIHPLNVMKEVGRVLKPGGKVVILFSNRLFIQKVSELCC